MSKGPLCVCGHHAFMHDSKIVDQPCVSWQCKCLAFTQKNALSHRTPVDGSPPACILPDGRTAREVLEQTRSVARTEEILKSNQHVPQLTDEELREYERRSIRDVGSTVIPSSDLLAMARECQDGRRAVTPRSTAEYILEWLHERNGGELAEVLDSQRVRDRRLMLDELEAIVTYRGKPPNWLPNKEKSK